MNSRRFTYISLKNQIKAWNLLYVGWRDLTDDYVKTLLLNKAEQQYNALNVNSDQLMPEHVTDTIILEIDYLMSGPELGKRIQLFNLADHDTDNESTRIQTLTETRDVVLLRKMRF